MTVRVYVNSAGKRTETIALVDCGATENFIDTDHAYTLRLPLVRLKTPREVFNMDKTPNRQGPITHYTDTAIRMGGRTRVMRFFLTHLGGNPLILGYPWFSGMEPRITWSKGWIDYNQLPIMLTPIKSTERETPPRVRQKASNHRPYSRQTTNLGIKVGGTPRYPERRLPTSRIPTTRTSIQ
jgi:hypothetical protein